MSSTDDRLRIALQDLVGDDPTIPFTHFVERLQERRMQRRLRATLQVAGGTGVAVAVAFVVAALAPTPTTDVAAPPKPEAADLVVDVGVDVTSMVAVGTRVFVLSPEGEMRAISAAGEV